MDKRLPFGNKLHQTRYISHDDLSVYIIMWISDWEQYQSNF